MAACNNTALIVERVLRTGVSCTLLLRMVLLKILPVITSFAFYWNEASTLYACLDPDMEVRRLRIGLAPA